MGLFSTQNTMNLFDTAGSKINHFVPSGNTYSSVFCKIWIIYWNALAGEPICFGDSGGPLYKSLGKGKGHVLLGVFSYILWGLCGGPRDLAYYVNVEHNIDWIFQYVPKNSTCRWVESCILHQGRLKTVSKLSLATLTWLNESVTGKVGNLLFQSSFC